MRYFTNLDVTPDQVHEIGLDEVARIQARNGCRRCAPDGLHGRFRRVPHFLRTDPQFYATTPDELLKDASYIAKQIDGMLPAYFGKLPRLPYSVAARARGARAQLHRRALLAGAASAATSGASIWVNTYALDQRPLYALTALTLHEAVPGHHLQIALAPRAGRRAAVPARPLSDAFGEGWGLYSEKLGMDMGIYKTPYDDFGRLTYEMWRACRLVVDTGMHALGWSREQALRLPRAANTALSEHEVRTEIDRYIAWPGQALAYKMGELKILELRARARAALGARLRPPRLPRCGARQWRRAAAGSHPARRARISVSGAGDRRSSPWRQWRSP